MANILDFYAQDMPTVHLASSGRNDFCGPCPRCGGSDRFLIKRNGALFYCRQCGAKGDAANYLVTIRGLTMAEALRSLGKNGTRTLSSFPCRKKQASYTKTAPELPNDKWQEAADKFCSWAMGNLEEDSAKDVLRRRHISIETARAIGIGYNPKAVFPQRSAWGLSGEGKFVIPSGLVLPVRREGKVVALEIRCYPPHQFRGKTFTHWQVVGSAGVCFGIGQSREGVVLFESVLDAALCWQESEHKISCIATTGASKRIDRGALDFIKQCRIIFGCPDDDEAGSGAWNVWRAQVPNLVPASVIGGKDLGEMQTQHNNGGRCPSVRQWLELAIYPHMKPAGEGKVEKSFPAESFAESCTADNVSTQDDSRGVSASFDAAEGLPAVEYSRESHEAAGYTFEPIFPNDADTEYVTSCPVCGNWDCVVNQQGLFWCKTNDGWHGCGAVGRFI